MYQKETEREKTKRTAEKRSFRKRKNGISPHYKNFIISINIKF